MKTYYYNVDDREFTLSSGDRMRVVPELFYQEHAVWRLCLRDRKDLPIDISGVTAWQAAVDNNYCSGSAPMARVLADGIIADAESGAVVIALDAASAEFLAAVNGATVKPAYFELVGFNARGERSLYVSFEIAARMTLDPDPTASGEIPETLATRTQVSAMVAGAVDPVSSALDEKIASVSGGLQTQLDNVAGGLEQRPTSSGAEVIASNAARNMLSNGGYAKDSETLPKDKPFSTTVGGYAVELTSNGGFSVHGSGASVTLSGGSVGVSTGSGLVATYDGGDLGAVAGVSIGYNGISAYTSGGFGGNALTLDNDYGMIFANGSAITQVTSEFDGTSLEINELSGGVKYVCQSALTALSIGSAAAGCNGTIIFTVASGAVITPPANVPYFGVTEYTAGSSYIMMVNDFAAVCNEAAIVPGV